MTARHAFKAFIVFFAASATLATMVSQSSAQDYGSMSCGDLWYRRNEIYARNGYCFKTDRAIRVFGNAGCRYEAESDVPMSRFDRRLVDEIRYIESRKGCGTY
jgi:hypothetical protein